MQLAIGLSLTEDSSLVWRRVSDLDSIPRYWHGTRRFQVVERGSDWAKANVVFAFGGAGKVEAHVDTDSKTLQIRYYDGVVKGTQVVKVRKDEIQVEWNVEFTGVYRLLQPFIKGHFRSGSAHALERLAGKSPLS